MYLRGLGQGPSYTKNGADVVAATVGDVISYTVPGRSEIWLEQTQNGNPQFSGPFTVPMAPYMLLARDAGYFQSAAYELTPQRTRGGLIGTATIQINLPAAATPAPVALPPGAGGPAPIMPTGFNPLPPPILSPAVSGPIDFGTEPPAAAPAATDYTMPIAIGAGVLALAFMFSGKKKR